MSHTSRNEPCPCGSGKKYKRCCGASGALTFESATTRFDALVVDSGDGYVQADRDRALDRLWRFGMEARFSEHCRRCLNLLWGRFADELRARADEIHRRWEITLSNELHHALVDIPMEGGRTVLQKLLARSDSGLRPAERRFLQDFARSCLSLYEIQRVEPGRGFEVVDLWRSTRQWVDERAASQQLARWDLLAARMLTRPDGRLVIDNDLWHFPPRRKAELIAALEREHASLLRKQSEIAPDAFLKLNSHVFAQAWAQDFFEPEKPELATFDGYPVEPTRHQFEVQDLPRLRRALSRCDEFETEGRDAFVWLELHNEIYHGLGWLTLAPGTLAAAAMCREHAGRLRTLLEAAAGDALTWKSTRTYAIGEWVAEGNSLRPPGEQRMSADEHALARKYESRHYEAWTDQALPALGGMTPRQAVADPKLRPLVIEMLKGSENHMQQRARSGGPPPVDLSGVWRTLGLETLGAATQAVKHDWPSVDLVAWVHQHEHALLHGRLRSQFERYQALVRAAKNAPLGDECMTEIACSRRPARRKCVGRLQVLVRGDDEPLRWRCAVCADGGELARWKDVLSVLERTKRGAVSQPRALRTVDPLDPWPALYAAAAEFKATAPWKWMLDEELFGVEDPWSGEIGWCCVLGAAMELEGLAVYRGHAGFDLWRRMHAPGFREEDALFGQDALVLAFVDRELLDPADRDRLRRLGLTFRGRGSWPQVDSHAFGRWPRPLDAAEARRFVLTIDEAMAVAERARAGEVELGADGHGRFLVRKRVLVAGVGAGWMDVRVDPPGELTRAVPAVDQKRVERLRATVGTLDACWEIDILPMPARIEGEGTEVCLPAAFLAVDQATGAVLSLELERPTDLLAIALGCFLATVEKVGAIPKRLHVCRPWMRDAIVPTARALGIELVQVDELRAIDAVGDGLMSALGPAPRQRRR